MSSATVVRTATSRPGALLGSSRTLAGWWHGPHRWVLAVLLLGLVGACKNGPGTGTQDQGTTDGPPLTDLRGTGDGSAPRDAAGADAAGADAAGADAAGADAAGRDAAGVDAAGADAASGIDAAGTDAVFPIDAALPDQAGGGGIDMTTSDMAIPPANLALRGAGFTSGGTCGARRVRSPCAVPASAPPPASAPGTCACAGASLASRVTEDFTNRGPRRRTSCASARAC